VKRHTEQFVGALFRTLADEGHAEAQEALLETYQSQASADRAELVHDLLSELVVVLGRHLDEREEVDVLTTAIEVLLNRFSTVIEASPAAILVVDTDGRIQLWNDGAERTFGWTAGEMTGLSYPERLMDSPETFDRYFGRLQDGERLTGVETRHHNRDGGVLDVRLWAAPLRSKENGFDGATFVISDITDRKQREQRLSVLNRLLRHNIRNDMAVVQGHLEMLAEEVPDDNPHVTTIEKRIDDVVDMSETARHIERLSDYGDADLTELDLATLLRDRLDRLCTETVEADVQASVPDSALVLAHELLPYAVDNVLENAVEHNDSTTPRVAVDVSPAPEESNQVTLHIADDGPGLPDTERKVLTADTETQLTHSTGVGLWLTRWIIRSSDCELGVDTSRFGGTRVSIRLPSAQEQSGASHPI